jgi:hypothetical protein
MCSLTEKAATKHDPHFRRFRELKTTVAEEREDERDFLGGILSSWSGKKWLNLVAAENKRLQDSVKRSKKKVTSHEQCKSCGTALVCPVCEDDSTLRVSLPTCPVIC